MGTRDLEESLRVLRQGYAARLPQRLEAIEAARSRAAAAGYRGPGLAELHGLLHRLAGSGSSFGFPAVTETARAAEAAIADSVRDGTAVPDEAAADFESRLEALRQACAAARAGG